MALGAVLISTSAVFVKWVSVGPTASAFWRTGLAALLLLAWLARPAVRAGWKPGRRVLGLLTEAHMPRRYGEEGGKCRQEETGIGPA